MERTRRPSSRLLQRFVPTTMGARLVLTAALIAFTTTAVTLGINAALVATRSEAWLRSDVAVTVQDFRSFLQIETQDLADSISPLAASAEFRALFAASDTDALQTSYGTRLLDATHATAIVGIDGSGRVIFSGGASGDVAALQALAPRFGSSEATGLVRLADGVAPVFATPVVSPDGSAAPGHLIVARVLDSNRLARFTTLVRTVTVSLHQPGYLPLGVDLRQLGESSGGVAYGTDGSAVIVIADLPAAGGGTIGTVELRDVDPRATRASSVAAESAVLAGLAALLIGLGLGLWLAGIMRRPIGRMIRQMQRRAEAASHGIVGHEELSLADPALPTEFQELAEVIEDLIDNLDERRVELERAVAEAESADETLGVVVNESSEAKIVLQDDRVIIANPAAAAALHAEQPDLVGHSATAVFSRVEIRTEEGAELIGAELVDQAFGGSITVSLTPRDGQQRWYAVEAVRHTDQRHEQVLLTARDVTEERRLSSIRAEIVSLVGHDLRSPLTVVIGYLDLLRRPMTDVERIRALDAARRSAARMTDLLEDLLTATRAEELLAPSDLVPTSLTEVADEVVASLAPTHSERPLLLERQCEPIVLGEEKRLRQMLVNLVTNAFKYSPDTEPITVRIRCDEHSAYLEVIDHGPGIAADDREHVFERFAQLHGGEGRSGIGLGLYIVSIIAHNHGGSARVEETPGGGATFVVELPLTGTMIDGEFVL